MLHLHLLAQYYTLILHDGMVRQHGRTELEHPQITEIRGTGLMLAPLFKNEDIVNKIIFRSIEKGLMLFWLLWEKKAIRITPPLTISHKEIKKGCRILRSAIDEVC